MPTDHPPHPQDNALRGSAANERERLIKHRGLATWGERLVPLTTFRTAAGRSGRALDADERLLARQRYLAPRRDRVQPEGPFTKIVVFGGIYNNHLALRALLAEAVSWGAEAIYCLGDFGGFGPNPEKTWPLLVEGAVRSIQGNYEQSLAAGAEDCNCGYADPRDNHFALLSYRYTERNCSPAFKSYMGAQPQRRRVLMGERNGRELLLVHGSPRRVNEFLFDSACPDPYLEVLLDQERCDGILCTHTGLHWRRLLPSGRDLINVGVIGRPANDGQPNVWYTRLEFDDSRSASTGDPLRIEHVPLHYDHAGLAAEMRAENLPVEFIETVVSGWWTTCLEILPAKERALSRY